jgi:DNA-directed RNA polymerase III subunit RPC1
VPRIEEIINGTKAISTPIIKAPLTNPHDEKQARVVKGLVEQTYLKDVCSLCTWARVRSLARPSVFFSCP